MIMISIVGRFVVIDTRLADAGEVWKIKRLPNRKYNDEFDRWVIPIRPGLGAAFEQIFGYAMTGALLEDAEAAYMETISPPVPGSIDPWKVSAGVAVELATTHKLYSTYDGDRARYARVYAPYVYGE